MNDLTPSPKGHLIVSIIKSVLRIIAGTALVSGSFIACGVLLVLAELLGIIEELV